MRAISSRDEEKEKEQSEGACLRSIFLYRHWTHWNEGKEKPFVCGSRRMEAPVPRDLTAWEQITTFPTG